jgi:hypothetical protein
MRARVRDRRVQVLGIMQDSDRGLRIDRIDACDGRSSIGLVDANIRWVIPWSSSLLYSYLQTLCIATSEACRCRSAFEDKQQKRVATSGHPQLALKCKLHAELASWALAHADCSCTVF